MSDEAILWMSECSPDRLTANRVMLCVRNEFILMNDRDFFIHEYNEIITASGNAAVIRE